MDKTDSGVAAGAGYAGPAGSRCECQDWCDPDVKHRLLTGHHWNCPNGKSATKAALELISELAKSMEAWAADEDGIHPEAWESYRRAKALEGVFLESSNNALTDS